MTSILGIFLGSALSWGAVVPSAFLAKKIVDRRTEIPQLVLQTQVERGSEKMTTQCLVDFKAREWRCQLFAAPQTEVYRWVRKIRTNTPPLAAFLFESEEQPFESLLQRMKVPYRSEQQLLQFRSEKQRREMDTVKLKRTEFGVVWAMGNDLSSLWIERNTFHPLRLVFQSSEVGAIQADFSKPQIFRGFAFPQELKVSAEGQTISERLLRYLPVNAKLSKDSETWTSGPTTALDASGLQGLVEVYLKIFR